MDLKDAIKLIENGTSKNKEHEAWADLGAGSGLFANALATKLAEGSVIYAVDKDPSSMNKLKLSVKHVRVMKIQRDFIQQELGLELLDGILMANALHFVKDKLPFIERLKENLKPSGKLIIVEYERESSNQWVPYPVNFAQLRSLANEAGFGSVTKLNEVASRYNQGNIYSAVIH